MTNRLLKLAKCQQLLIRFRCFFYGLLLPLAFAPFHIPGFAILSLGLFYFELGAVDKSTKQSLNKNASTSHFFPGFKKGLAYGLGFFGLGTSWIYVSIHDYGHLLPILSALITLLFILYLSLFPAVMAGCYHYLRLRPYSVLSVLLFSALWTLSEYLRATFLTGFPWLLVGAGQIDAPTRTLLPFIGVYGVTLVTCIASGTLILIFKQSRQQHPYSSLLNFRSSCSLSRGLIDNPEHEVRSTAPRLAEKSSTVSILPVLFFLLILLSPALLHQKNDNVATAEPLSIGVVQSNISMRDKWDEQLFWQLLKQNQQRIQQLLGTKLIVLPEAAIPLPASYIQDTLEQLSNEARLAGSALLLGIPETTEFNDTVFYNALIALGQAKGTYLKQHLVPFGEYNPTPLRFITQLLNLPDPNMHPGDNNQQLVKVHHIPVATLICYELAYGNLLRAQLPTAQFIISISDDGWFGHSLAMYQHLQIAQVQSLQTERYQVVANNDGLSSIIDSEGNLTASLAPFTSGVLKASLIPKTTITPWVKMGDFPALFCAGIITLFCLARRLRKITSDDLLLLSKSRRAILTGQFENNK